MVLHIYDPWDCISDSFLFRNDDLWLAFEFLNAFDQSLIYKTNIHCASLLDLKVCQLVNPGFGEAVRGCEHGVQSHGHRSIPCRRGSL